MPEALLPSPDRDGSIWAIATGAEAGAPYVIRFRSDLISRIGDPSLPNLLEMRWTFFGEGPLSNGLPTAGQLSEMEAFESQAIAALERSQNAILFAVRTGAGSRHWFWYCSSRDLVEQSLNAVLAGDASLPINMSMTVDPEWAVYADLLELD